jgi:hypothetical protein
MHAKLPTALSASALAIAVLGTTPLGAIAQNAAFPRNSVGSAQLQRNAVTAAKLAPNAVRAGHVLDGSLLAADFKPGQLPQGPKGDKGDKGERGDKGDPGATTVVVRRNELTTTAFSAVTTRAASCEAGERAVGGGAGPVGGGTNGAFQMLDVRILFSQPVPNASGSTPTGWEAGFSWPTNAPGRTIAAYVVCARP